MAKRKTFSLNQDLQQGLTQTMTAVRNYAGALRFEIIPLKQIELDPENPRDMAINFNDILLGIKPEDPHYQRKNEELESLQSLAETIKLQGIINPIVVYKTADKYRVIAGERRCLASHIAGLQDIKANILDEKPSPYKRTLLQWIENIERADLKLWERIHNIEVLVKHYQNETKHLTDVTPTLIKKLLGCSMPHAMNYCAVILAHEDIKNAIREDKIRNLEKAALLTKVHDDQHRAVLLSACITGKSFKELKNIVARIHISQNSSPYHQTITVNPSSANKRVNLGTTSNPQAVKFLVETILAHEDFQHYATDFDNHNWHNHSAASLAFRRLMNILETSIVE